MSTKNAKRRRRLSSPSTMKSTMAKTFRIGLGK